MVAGIRFYIHCGLHSLSIERYVHIHTTIQVEDLSTIVLSDLQKSFLRRCAIATTLADRSCPIMISTPVSITPTAGTPRASTWPTGTDFRHL